MNTAGNLVIENTNGDYYISSKAPFKLVEFDYVGYGIDIPENGAIRMRKSGAHDDLYILQLRGMLPQHDREDISPVMACARISGAELKKLCDIAFEIAGDAIEETTEDVLRSRIQDLEQEVQSLNLLLKDKEDEIHLMQEG